MKAYPGAVCRQSSVGGHGFHFGTVYNTSTTSELNLVCPLVQDLSPLASGSVTFFDSNPDRSCSCTIWSEFVLSDSSGLVYFDNASVGTTIANNSVNPFVKTFGAIDAGDLYYATCSIARWVGSSASHVVTMSITES